MLTVRIQAIDGTGTCTLSDSQPCRLLTLLHRHYPASSLLLPRPTPAVAAALRDVEAATLARNGSPPLTTNHPSDVPCPLPRRIKRVLMSIASPLVQPSPNGRRVGIRIVTIEACSGFTRVTARRIAQPPKATFVTRLQPERLPARAARQLPDQSTTLRVDSSSTDDSRLRGALPQAVISALISIRHDESFLPNCSGSCINFGSCGLLDQQEGERFRFWTES